jgi:hypothetical protein
LKDEPFLVGFEGYDHEPTTPRELMIHTSLAIKETLGDDVWIDHCLARIHAAFVAHNVIVVHGVRPQGEIDALRDLEREFGRGGTYAPRVVVIKVVCTDDPPVDNEDELERQIDLIEPDFVVRAQRDPDGLGQTLMGTMSFELVGILTKHPELIPLFDPGEAAEDDLPPMPEPMITTHEE